MKNTTLNIAIELDNKEAFKLLKNQVAENIKIIPAYTKTSFLKQASKGWFKSLMEMLWVAS